MHEDKQTTDCKNKCKICKYAIIELLLALYYYKFDLSQF